MIVSVVLARALGPQRYGLYSLVMTVIMFTFVVSRLGINDTVRRYVAELDGRNDRAAAALVGSRGLALGLLTSGAAALVLALGATALAAFFHRDGLRPYFILGAIGLLPMMAGGVLRNVLGGLQQYRYLVRMNIITSPIWVVASTAVVLSGHGIWGLLVVGMVVETVNLAILGWWAYREVGIPHGQIGRAHV